MNLRSPLTLTAYNPASAVRATDMSTTQIACKSEYQNAAGFRGPGSTVHQFEDAKEKKTTAFRIEAFDETLAPLLGNKKKLADQNGSQLVLPLTTPNSQSSTCP